MPHSIDLAWIECKNCGHRCTSPSAINSNPHEMEILEVHPGRFIDDPLAQGGKRHVIDELPNEAAYKAQLEQKYPGNSVIIRNEGGARVVRLSRSYANVQFQDKTELAESDHIILACPQCDEVLYEVKFGRRKKRMYGEPD